MSGKGRRFSGRCRPGRAETEPAVHIKEGRSGNASRFGGCQPYRELAEWSDDI